VASPAPSSAKRPEWCWRFADCCSDHAEDGAMT
jgi:hypothetical protein